MQEACLDPVPNRHAALHGRVSYASEKSSLNMLIMTDFIFDAISKVAREDSARLAAECCDNETQGGAKPIRARNALLRRGK